MTDSEPRKYSRSVSQWKGLVKCGAAFELERLHRSEVPRRPAAWSISGSAFHEALLDWEKSERTIDLAESFEAHYDRMVQQELEKQPNLDLWMKPPRTKSVEQDIKNYRKRFLERDVPNYEAQCRVDEWEILRLDDGQLAIELGFEIDLDGITVRGAVDRIQWWPTKGHAAIEDTKTGSPDNHEHDHRQLGLYGLAMEMQYGINLAYGRYWFTKVDRGSAWVNLDRYTYEYLSAEIKKVDQMVQQGLFLANPGKHCELCPVQPYCPEKGWLTLGEEFVG